VQDFQNPYGKMFVYKLSKWKFIFMHFIERFDVTFCVAALEGVNKTN